MLAIKARARVSHRFAVSVRLGAVLTALIMAAIFLAINGYQPFSVYGAMLQGAFATHYRFTETIIKCIPLVIASLGIALAFRMKFWNIGGEGQIITGAIGATFCALNFPNLPSILLIPLMMLAGLVCGGCWALIPAFFRARFETNETIFTLMMNYLALQLLTWLQYGPWKDPAAMGFPKIANFSSNAVLPHLFGIHSGWLIAVLLAVLVHVFMRHTKRGYEIAVVGESMNTARYAGINPGRTILFTIFMSGALCGLTGMIQASAVSKTLSTEITGGVGYTAIITAWLSGLSAPMMVLVCFLFAAMIQGGSFIQMAYSIPQSAVEILQTLILFSILGAEFFLRYQIIRSKPAATAVEASA